MRKKIGRFLSLWLPPLTLMAIIFYLSSRTSFHVSPRFWLNFLFFKSLHLAEYFLLGILVIRAIKNTFISWSPDIWALASFLWTFSWAVSDEIHQLYVQTRSGTLRDIFIDAFGFLLAYLCVWKLLPAAPLKLKNWAKKLQLV